MLKKQAVIGDESQAVEYILFTAEKFCTVNDAKLIRINVPDV